MGTGALSSAQSAGMLLMCMLAVASAAGTSEPVRRLQAQTCSGNNAASDDVICGRGAALVADAVSTPGSTAAECCTCAPGKSTVYNTESLAFQFRADGITTSIDGSLLWNAAVPSGLAFTTSRPEDSENPEGDERGNFTIPAAVSATGSVPVGIHFDAEPDASFDQSM